MYPRLNPKFKRNSSQNKPRLNILNDQNSFLPKSHHQNIHFIDNKHQIQCPKIKELSAAKDLSYHNLFTCYQKDTDIFSSCQNQLSQKYNHLIGKRRSEQMSIILYRQISQEKTYRNTQKRSPKQMRFNSLRKIQVNNIQKKKQFNRFSERNQSKQKQQQYNWVYQQPYRLPKRPFEPLCELKNQVRYQNQEYQKYKKCHNFLPKVMKKSSFFRNKIIEQIISNDINQWKADDFQDQCIF